MYIKKLTAQQVKSLSKDDQALLERGLINDDLTPTDEGFRYQRRWAFETNRKALAEQAAKETAEFKAQLEAATK